MNERHTNRKSSSPPGDEMRAEYDFSGAVRGKYYKRYLECTNVAVLESDVARRFRNSEAVNEALRSLMKPASAARRMRTRKPAAR